MSLGLDYDDGAGISVESVKMIRNSIVNSKTPIVVFKSSVGMSGHLGKADKEYLNAGANLIFSDDKREDSVGDFVKVITPYLNSHRS